MGHAVAAALAGRDRPPGIDVIDGHRDAVAGSSVAEILRLILRRARSARLEGWRRSGLRRPSRRRLRRLLRARAGRTLRPPAAACRALRLRLGTERCVERVARHPSSGMRRDQGRVQPIAAGSRLRLDARLGPPPFAFVKTNPRGVRGPLIKQTISSPIPVSFPTGRCGCRGLTRAPALRAEPPGATNARSCLHAQGVQLAGLSLGGVTLAAIPSNVGLWSN